MQFLHRPFLSDLRRSRLRQQIQIRFIYDEAISLERPRDTGLDHAVSRERFLRPILNLKNFIITNPYGADSTPYAKIEKVREKLEMPCRPLELIRAYPTVFQQVIPGSIGDEPDIKLTPEAIALHSHEKLLYQSVDYKQDVASRLLKLLMINRVNKIPIRLLDKLRWDLGLPHDYEEVIVPEFPDYFRVVKKKKNRGGNYLELVFWNDEFAVSEMEQGAKDGEVEFRLPDSTDKAYKKWLREWQKLPYVSPYKNALHLTVKSDESDKWAVGMLHEVLNLFVGKKAERESLLCLGEHLGLRARFKLALLQHPGIFYSSSKIWTRTIVLREAYKRGALVKSHALMDVRFKYVRLMRTEEKEKDNKTGDKSGTNLKKDVVEDSESEEEDGDVMYDSSDDYDSSEEEDEDEDEVPRGRHGRDINSFKERSVDRRSNGRRTQENKYESLQGFSRRTGVKTYGYAPRRSNRNSDDYEERGGRGEYNRRGTFSRGSQRFEEKNVRSVEWRSNGRGARENEYESSRRFSRRTDAHSDGGYDTRKTERIYVTGEDRSASRRDRPNRGFDRFEEKNVRRNVERRSNYENENESSNRFSRRNDVRGESDATRSLSLSRNRPKLKTEVYYSFK